MKSKRKLAKAIKLVPCGVASVVVLLLIIYVSLSPDPVGISRFHLMEGADKFVHFLMYFVLCITVIFDYAKTKLPHHISLNPELGLVAFSVLVGFVLELAQLFLQVGRSFEYADIVANASGAVVGFLAEKFWLMHQYRKLMVPVYSHRHHHHRRRKDAVEERD